MLPFCFAFAITSNNQVQAEKVLLKVNAVKNQKFEYVNEIEMTNEDIGNLHAKFGMRYFVTDVSDTEISEDIAITSNTFTGLALVNTPEFAQAKFVGAWTKRKLNFAGNVIEDGSSSKIPIGMPIDLVFAVNPVKVGDTWTVPFYAVPEFGRILVTYKLIGITPDEATITAESDRRDQLEILKPFLFVVERKTGRCKSASGKFRCQVVGADFEVEFERTLVPPK